LKLENGWLRCSTQLTFLKKNHGIFDEDHLRIQLQSMHELQCKVQNANDLLARLLESRTIFVDGRSQEILVPKKLKYALRKNNLDRSIAAMKDWQEVSDPSFFLIFRMANQQIEASSANAVAVMPSISSIRSSVPNASLSIAPTTGLSLPPAALTRMFVTRISFAPAQLAVQGSSAYILDTVVTSETAFYDKVKRDTRDLAQRLQHTEPETFNLLTCKGFVAEKARAGDQSLSKVTVVFRAPQANMTPRSLRDLLMNIKRPGSLSYQFQVAKQLANAVCYVHTFGFVHKNIRPETTLCFLPPGSNLEVAGAPIPSVFLVGFENFRKEAGRTQRFGDDSFENNLYRHATRQGIHPESDYVMQHDIYSLGVCLLEIGLWECFVDYGNDANNPSPSKVLSLPDNASMDQTYHYLRTAATNNFLEMAQTRLPTVVGTLYAEVVETCLTCLDPKNSDFGDSTEFEDEDGIRVGVRYIEKVSMILFQRL
jgi:hypothetical protein